MMTHRMTLLREQLLRSQLWWDLCRAELPAVDVAPRWRSWQ